MRNLGQTLVLVGAAVLLAARAPAENLTYETIPAVDGVPLVVAEAGKTGGPAILFIHGYAQGLLAWKKQLGDPDLAAKYRMVALDLRGHGASGKPWTEDGYENRDWADDIARVIEAKSLCRPVLVGWSFGGSVMAAYVRHYGEENIAGLVFAAGAMSFAEAPPRPSLEDENLPPELIEALERSRKMLSPNIADSIDGTSAFVDSLIHGPMESDLRQEMLVLNMMTPAYTRKIIIDNLATYEDLAGQIETKTLFIHGDKDAVIPNQFSFDNQQLVPESKVKIYPNIGHSPFLEDPSTFNRDLSGFMDRVSSHEGC